ncbi:ubiquinol-cytochrome C chaperone family protein [Xanthobacter sp. KR7-225]|uniref:ubiquinol-cytochrome C chaperone family protein n=1 Tax=Xanthobacter sp. KR7-225 TaxID=3156613 RepID=UPI0032B4D75D
MFNLFRPAATRRTIERLYGGIVAQSRHPHFYATLGVPDTHEGRFEMVVLHTALVCRRLKDGGASERALSQDVFDAFVADMDRTLREMGVGDLSVPKKMKKIGAAFYGRATAYDAALRAAGDDALAAALARNILDRTAQDDPVPERALAGYVRRATAALDRAPWDVLARGAFAFPAPDASEDL